MDTTTLDVATKEAFAVLEELLEELGPRKSATDQETAARYLQIMLQESGYDTEIQEFIVEDLSLAGMGLTLNKHGRTRGIHSAATGPEVAWVT